MSIVVPGAHQYSNPIPQMSLPRQDFFRHPGRFSLPALRATFKELASLAEH
jgi:hypothetical protein